MNSKTSLFDRFFSKAIIKADLRNHWPWPVAMTVILFFNLLGVADSGTALRGRGWNEAFASFSSMFYFSFFAACIYSFFIGTKLFMYLDKMNSVSCMHGLPFSRCKLYFSHILSGTVLALIPPAVITAAMLILGAPFKNTVFMPSICFLFLAIYAIYSMIAFSISVFSMTVCGNVIVSMLLSCGIAVLPAAFIGFIEYICYQNIYGYVGGELGVRVLKFLYLLPDMVLSWRFLIYVIASVLFIAAGCFVYKKRPLENCEEVVAFRKLRWMFVFAVGIVLGMISYMFFSGILDNDSPICMLPLGLAGIIGAAMFAKKSVSLKGTGGYIVSYIALVLVISGVLEFDLLGYEKRIPSANSVEYVEIETDYAQSYYPDWIEKAVSEDYRITDKDEIELVRALHSAYISEKDNAENSINEYNRYSFYSYDGISFKYKLNSGITLERRYYYLDKDSFDKYMLPVLNTKSQKSKKYPFIDSAEKEILSVGVYNDIADSYDVYNYPGDEAQKICEALRYDIENNTVEDLYADGYISIEVRYYVEGTHMENLKLPSTLTEKNDNSFLTNMRINENWTETVELLKEMGYYSVNNKTTGKADTVIVKKHGFSDGKYPESASYDDEIYGGFGYGYGYEDDLIYGGTEVTDSEDIAKIYELCANGFGGIISRGDLERVETYSISFLKSSRDGGSGDREILYSSDFELLPEDVPAELRKYF